MLARIIRTIQPQGSRQQKRPAGRGWRWFARTAFWPAFALLQGHMRPHYGFVSAIYWQALATLPRRWGICIAGGGGVVVIFALSNVFPPL